MNPALQSDAHAVRCDLAAEVLRSSGRLRLRVTGWSMLPAVWPGDTLLIDRSDADRVSEGDVVLFARERRFFVHRVVKKNSEGSKILARGDAMPHPDPPFAQCDLMGKVSVILRKDKCIVPRSRLSFAERVISALAQRSAVAARAIVAVHELFHNPCDVSLSSN